MRPRTRARRASGERATDREVSVVAAVLVAGSEKAAAHRLGLSHSTVKHHLANARSKVGATTTAQLGVDPGAAAARARGYGADGRIASARARSLAQRQVVVLAAYVSGR